MACSTLAPTFPLRADQIWLTFTRSAWLPILPPACYYVRWWFHSIAADNGPTVARIQVIWQLQSNGWLSNWRALWTFTRPIYGLTANWLCQFVYSIADSSLLIYSARVVSIARYGSHSEALLYVLVCVSTTERLAMTHRLLENRATTFIHSNRSVIWPEILKRGGAFGAGDIGLAPWLAEWPMVNNLT